MIITELSHLSCGNNEQRSLTMVSLPFQDVVCSACAEAETTRNFLVEKTTCIMDLAIREGWSEQIGAYL
jgi:hypothetical protein